MNTNATDNSYVLLLTIIEQNEAMLRKRRITLEALRAKLEQLWLPVTLLTEDHVDFDNLSHADVIKVIKVFGGKWDKRPNYDGSSIDYSTKWNGICIRCYSGEPPANCKLVEVEEVIPAQHIPEKRVKRMKLQCIPEKEIIEG